MGFPESLIAFRAMDDLCHRILKLADDQASHVAGTLPVNSVFGPWESGIPATEVGLAPAKSLKFEVAAMNVRGGFGRAVGGESFDQNIMSVAASLHLRGVIAAVISEPCLAPGMVWPELTGYVFFWGTFFEP